MFQTIIPMDKATVGLSFYEQLFEDGKIELIEFEEAIRQMQQIQEMDRLILNPHCLECTDWSRQEVLNCEDFECIQHQNRIIRRL